MRLTRRQSRNLIAGAVWTAALVLGFHAFAQGVILHLKNGDRIAGTIVSETTNQVTVSTVWIKELKIPLAQIDRRETVTTNAPGTNAPAAAAAPKTVPSPAVAVAAPPKHPWLRRWKGEVSMGTDVILGAVDQELYHAHASLTYAQPYHNYPKQFFRNTLTYNAEYGRADGVLSANKMDGASKTDFDVSKRTYLYNLGGAGYDEIRLIDLHFEEGPGFGYHLVARTNFAVNLELGANYQLEDRSDTTVTRNFYYRLAENVTWKINKQLQLTEKLECFPQADQVQQFRARFESTLSYALMLNLSLNMTVLDLYDTRPAAGVDRNEFQLRTSLGVKF